MALVRGDAGGSSLVYQSQQQQTKRVFYMRWRDNLCFMDSVLTLLLNCALFRASILSLSASDIEPGSVVDSIRFFLSRWDDALSELDRRTSLPSLPRATQNDDDAAASVAAAGKNAEYWETSFAGEMQRRCENALDLHGALYMDRVRLLGTPMTVLPLMLRASCNATRNIPAISGSFVRVNWTCSQNCGFTISCSPSSNSLPLSSSIATTTSRDDQKKDDGDDDVVDLSTSDSPWICNNHNYVPPDRVLQRQVVSIHRPLYFSQGCTDGLVVCDILFREFPSVIIVEYKRDSSLASNRPAMRVEALHANKRDKATYSLSGVLVWIQRILRDSHFYTILFDHESKHCWAIDDMGKPRVREIGYEEGSWVPCRGDTNFEKSWYSVLAYTRVLEDDDDDHHGNKTNLVETSKM